MANSQKIPTILVIDDVVGQGASKNAALMHITRVIDVLGYDDQQKENILKNIRFFAQYNEKDGNLPAEACAAHYLKTRNGDTELPVLAFIDNRFKVGGGENHHGCQIVDDLKNEAEKRGEILPAMVWISSDPSPQNIIKAEKLRIRPNDSKAIFELAKSPYKEAKAGDTYENYGKSQDQVLIHTLRDAFEAIAGPPNEPEIWQQWVRQQDRMGKIERS